MSGYIFHSMAEVRQALAGSYGLGLSQVRFLRERGGEYLMSERNSRRRPGVSANFIVRFRVNVKHRQSCGKRRRDYTVSIYDGNTLVPVN